MSYYAKEVDKCLCAIKNGDMSQFKSLIDLIGNHLCVVVKFYLNDKSYLEDVIDEVFAKVYKYINSYVEGSDGYNWICKIAENIAYSYNAKCANEISLFEAESLLKLNPSDIISEDKIDLNRAIDSLDEKSRELVYKHFFLGKTLTELGEEYKISKAAIKKRLDKCVEILKKFIASGKLY